VTTTEPEGLSEEPHGSDDRPEDQQGDIDAWKASKYSERKRISPKRSEGPTRREIPANTGRFVAQDEAARFWSKVTKSPNPDGCWTWTGARTTDGYGRFSITVEPGRYRHVKAHRWSYEHTIGPIPDGLTIDHHDQRCRNRACVNPDHLEPVTRTENIRRAAAHRRRERPRSDSL
jgi:hypothetical protein